MKLISLSLKYGVKNFFRLLPFVVLPAVLFAFCYDFSRLWVYLGSVGAEGTIAFSIVYSHVSLIANRIWYINFAAIILFVLCIGCLFCMIDRHMRIGRFTYKFYRYFPEVFKIAVPIVFICLGVMELLAFLVSGLIVLLSLFIPMIAMKYIAILLVCVAVIIFVLLLCTVTVWVPSCTVRGYKFSEGFSSSVRLSGKHFGKLFLAWLFPLLIWFIANTLSGLYLGKYVVFVSIAINSFCMVYFVSLVMASFFLMHDYERRDKQLNLFFERRS